MIPTDDLFEVSADDAAALKAHMAALAASENDGDDDAYVAAARAFLRFTEHVSRTYGVTLPQPPKRLMGAASPSIH